MDLVSSVPSRIPLGKPSLSEVLQLLKRSHHLNQSKLQKKNRKSKYGCKNTKNKNKNKNNNYNNENDYNDNNGSSTTNNIDLIMNTNDVIDKPITFADDSTNKELNELEKIKLYFSAVAEPCKGCQKHYNRLGIRPWTLIPDESKNMKYNENENQNENQSEHKDKSKDTHSSQTNIRDENRDNENEVKRVGTIKNEIEFGQNEEKLKFSAADYTGRYGIVKPDDLCSAGYTPTYNNDVSINKNVENISIPIPIPIPRNVLYGLQRCREILLRNSHLLPR